MSTTRVYIGRLNRDITRRDLERLFRGYGVVGDITLKQGFGFAEFDTEKDAKEVVYDFHGRSVMGERITVEIARGTRRDDERRSNGNDRRRSHYRLVVENIAPGTNWQDLKDLMRKAGEVVFADISRDRPTEGLVEFAVRDDMEYALKKLNDRELNGQRVTLREDSGRSSGRSSRRSRSRSKSRSRSPPRRRRRSPSESRSPPRRRRRSPSGSRSASRSRSPPSKRRRSSRDDGRDRRVKSESRSRSRSPVKSPGQSPARSEESAPRDD